MSLFQNQTPLFFLLISPPPPHASPPHLHYSFPYQLDSMDFMNVDSFSQLPFKRPPSLINNRDRPADDQKGIRLFGIQFSSSSTDDDDSKTRNDDDDSAKDIIENGRKFECHYCCRSFRTSQALGGHQNAHKRERQNAKRAHLHSNTAHNSSNNILLEAQQQQQQQQQQQHIYGFPNYHLPRSGSSNMSNGLYGRNNVLFLQPPAPTPIHGSPFGSPIHGSPFGSWRVSSSSRQFYESKASRVQEHVSLDLRL